MRVARYVRYAAKPLDRVDGIPGSAAQVVLVVMLDTTAHLGRARHDDARVSLKGSMSPDEALGKNRVPTDHAAEMGDQLRIELRARAAIELLEGQSSGRAAWYGRACVIASIASATRSRGGSAGWASRP